MVHRYIPETYTWGWECRDSLGSGFRVEGERQLLVFSNTKTCVLRNPGRKPRGAHTTQRTEAVRRWLAGRPEEYIVLVSHYNFLRDLLGTKSYIENCNPMLCAVDTDGSVAVIE